MAFTSIKKVSLVSRLGGLFKSSTKSSNKWIEKLRNNSLINYLSAVKEDYKQVLLDVIQESREKPRKALFYGTLLPFLGYAFKTNPDEGQFYEQLVSAHNEMGLIDKRIRNPAAYQHIHRLNSLDNERTLRTRNLIFFSILWRDNFDPKCGLFESQCQYLKPTIISYFTDRVVDIGFLGEWRLINAKLADYDVNPNEWEPKPLRMDQIKLSDGWEDVSSTASGCSSSAALHLTHGTDEEQPEAVLESSSQPSDNLCPKKYMWSTLGYPTHHHCE